jgi:hypothetical protein
LYTTLFAYILPGVGVLSVPLIGVFIDKLGTESLSLSLSLCLSLCLSLSISLSVSVSPHFLFCTVPDDFALQPGLLFSIWALVLSGIGYAAFALLVWLPVEVQLITFALVAFFRALVFR